MIEPNKAAELDKKIKGSNEFRIYNRLIYLSDIFYIFNRNYNEFQRLLMIYGTPQAILQFFDDEKRDEFHIINNELNRCFHNYVASSQTLAEHTRIIIRESYKNSEFMNEYQERVDYSFKCNPVSVFIKDLRNFTLHYSLPITLPQVEFSQDLKTKRQTASSKAVLQKDSLLHDYKWDSISRHYLDGFSEEIDLMGVINQHHEIFLSFYEWLFNRLKEIHAPELNWLENETAELHRLVNLIYKLP
jgi:hypothetical protein